MDKEYICGKAFGKHSALVGDHFYMIGDKFTRIDEHALVDANGVFLCNAHSQFARDTILVGNDDRKGKERYILCKEIIDFLLNREGPEDFEKRVEPGIDRLQDNKVAMKYNQNASDPSSPWIWNDNFYCAPIKDLRYIKRLLYDGEG